MRIGDLAKATGLSTPTLRYYEQVGIMPEPKRTPGGYRTYSSDALERLQFVRAAQQLGLTLDEIREVIDFRDGGESPCDHVTTVIDRHLADVDDRIRELEQMRRELQVLATRARTLDPSDCRPGDICHVIPRPHTRQRSL